MKPNNMGWIYNLQNVKPKSRSPVPIDHQVLTKSQESNFLDCGGDTIYKHNMPCQRFIQKSKNL